MGRPLAARSGPAWGALVAGGIAVGVTLASTNDPDEPLVEVWHRGREYGTVVEVVAQAPPEAVLAALTDYGALNCLHKSIEDSGVLEARGERSLVLLNSHHCILVFCFDITMVLEYASPSDDGLQATFVTGLSDFRDGGMRWQVAPEGSGTRLRYEAYGTPDFWVPPLIGPPIIKARLGRMAVELSQALAARVAADP